MTNQRVAWSSAGLLLALLVGLPAAADDTELLLLTPAESADSKPNILFILDTSGSMGAPPIGNLVETRAPYDSTQPYAGSCATESLYWSDVDVVPTCTNADGTPDSTHAVAKTAFVCDAADGPLSSIGTYSDTMVQYRATDEPDISRWQELEPGHSDAKVECQEDNGVHGEGTADELWASSGAGAGAFTSDETQALSWGSAPATVTYTVYDGNYLNWQNSATLITMEKIAILQAVTKAVLNASSDVNVGIMRFNDNDGGPVIKAISDLDSQRSELLATVDSLTANGSTPLSETMYEAARYWHGLPAWYGESIDEFPTDPDALDSTAPEDYRQPQTNVCSRNFNVLVTDGLPNNDEDTPGLLTSQPLPGYAAEFGGTACDGSGEGSCLDDVTRYLATVDTDAQMDGDQVVTTYTIGFDIDIPILEEAATDGGGTYFLADDVQSLARAMLTIVNDITEQSLSFAAPSVSINAFNRTQNLNDLYLTVFSPRTNIHWPGNLKKYRIAEIAGPDGEPMTAIVDANGTAAVNPATGFFLDSALSVWTDGPADGSNVTRGGAANELPDPANRDLYTNNGSDPELTAGINAIHMINADAFEVTDFGLIGTSGEPTEEDMINWMRGADVQNEDDNDKTAVRDVMGDSLHSQPAAIMYGSSAANPDVVVFTATNDGYLHAIDGETGEELWAFVPHELLDDMARLYFDPSSNYKHYGIDGSIVPVIHDEDNDGVIESPTDFRYIIFGLRRGGRSYYALDVTDRESPRLLWMKQYTEIGESWSTPVVARVNVIDSRLNGEKAVVIVGGGYDPVHDAPAPPSAPDAQGAGIHMLDLVTGERLWWAGPGGSGAHLKLDDMTRAIPSRISVIDISGDGFADRMYAADLGGQIWRFDIANGNTPPELVAGGVIARLGAEGLDTPSVADNRRFYNSPDVSLFTDPIQGRSFIAVSIGSGYRAHPLDNDTVDRFYSIRDEDVFRQLTQPEYDGYDVVTDTELTEVRGQAGVTLDADDRGWRFTLPDNQKVLVNSTTFDDTIFFVGFSPEANNANACQPSNGRNFLYRVSVVNGDPVVAFDAEVLPDDARVLVLDQGGIAPAATFLFPGATGTDCEDAGCPAPPPIYCVGRECFDPGFDNDPVRTLWTAEGIE